MPAARYATRLNSFASRPELFWPDLNAKPSALRMAERAATVSGLTDLDLNYPDHLAGEDPAAFGRRLADLGLAVNGLAMRFYGAPAFKLGAYTNPDAAVRREAIDLTRRGIDAARATGATLMTVWPGQDGFDLGFQADYRRLWDWAAEAFGAVAAHDPEVMVSIEYKPNEPRAFSLLPDAATTLLLIREVGAENLGVTLDFAHSLYADERPAFAAQLIARHAHLLGLHLNDGYGKRDDGLMVAAVHPQETLELLLEARRIGYSGAIYFDTFPDASGLDPAAECAQNIRVTERLLSLAERLDGDNRLGSAQAVQDAVAAQAVVQELLIGA